MIFLVSVKEKAILNTSYLVELLGEEFKEDKAREMIASGKAEQFDSEYQGNTGELEISSAIPFGVKALKTFKEKIRPYIEQEKLKLKTEKEEKKEHKKKK